MDGQRCPTSATSSMRSRRSRGLSRNNKQIRDEKFGFAGAFVDGQAAIEFSASNDDSSVVYRSVAKGQHALYAGVGRERNGIFFT